MKKRIEMHIESSYSKKNMESVIGTNILEKLKKEEVGVVSIVDYCDCSGIIEFEKKKLELFRPDKFKIIYGISLNIKYDDLYVPSVILAKNTNGLKALYHLVSLMNERDCYFVLEEDITKYLNDLILGISDFDTTKNYSTIISKYTYVEIGPTMNQDEVLKINKYCLKNNLLLVGSSKPKRINKEDLVLSEVYYQVHGIKSPPKNSEYYYSTEEMLKKFNYLENKEDIVSNNAYKIIEKIENYDFNYNKKELIKCHNKKEFREDVIERANLIYLDNLSEKVKTRLQYELNFIEENNLEGTFSLLEGLFKRLRYLGYYVDASNELSSSFVAYILGINRINPMDYDRQEKLFKGYEIYGFNFDLLLPQEAVEELKKYIKEVLGENKIFRKRVYSTNNVSRINSIKTSLKLTQEQCNTLEQKLNEISVNTYFKPCSYVVIPKDVDVEDYSPIIYSGSEKTLSFDHNYLRKIFININYKTPHVLSKFKELEEKTGDLIDNIDLNNKEIFDNLFEVVSNNTKDNYRSFIHYNMENNFYSRLKLELNNKDIPNNIYELLNLKQFIYRRTKILLYYFDTYYRIYYPEIYYEIYLKKLIEYFEIKDLKNKDKEEVKLIFKIIDEMKKIGLNAIAERMIKNE